MVEMNQGRAKLLAKLELLRQLLLQQQYPELGARGNIPG